MESAPDIDEVLIEFSKVTDREFEVIRRRLQGLAGVRELNMQGED